MAANSYIDSGSFDLFTIIASISGIGILAVLLFIPELFIVSLTLTIGEEGIESRKRKRQFKYGWSEIQNIKIKGPVIELLVDGETVTLQLPNPEYSDIQEMKRKIRDFKPPDVTFIEMSH